MRLRQQRGAAKPAPVMLPVQVSALPLPAAPVQPRAARTIIEIELAGAVVRVPEGADAQHLRLVLQALRT